jgi:hypothetical protein
MSEFDDSDFKAFAKHIRTNMVPAMRDSAYVITIAPDGSDADIKIAVEIGTAILLNKPLVVLKIPGRVVAEKLLRIADHVIEGDMATEAGRESVLAQMNRVLRQ